MAVPRSFPLTASSGCGMSICLIKHINSQFILSYLLTRIKSNTILWPIEKQEETMNMKASGEKGHLPSARKSNITLKIPVYLSNEIGNRYQTCPSCRSVLKLQRVYPSIRNVQGDCYNTNSVPAWCCSICHKAYISRETAEVILRRLDWGKIQDAYLALANYNVKFDRVAHKYSYDPIADANPMIYDPEKTDQPPKKSTDRKSNLHDASFLSKMGYSVNAPEEERCSILYSAVRSYGKHRIKDYLIFLIENRKLQENGNEKYARAIYTWEEDLDFVEGLHE